MDIITSHNSLDFDGLAAMVAAGKLYPSAVKVFSGTLARNVKQFMALYKDSLTIKTPGQIDLQKVERVILVDTKNLKRLGSLKGLEALNCRYIIYDHHPPSPEDLVGEVNEVHMVGAATTILVEKIKEAGLDVSPFEATILALGIYEDTGSLMFSSTTVRDVLAVAYLLERGANLTVVNAFIGRTFSSEQRQLMQRLLSSAIHYQIKGLDVVVAVSEEEGFTPGLDLVVHRLAEVEAADAVFVLAVMQGKLNVVARSQVPNIQVNKILFALGGRGHEKAASAVVKNMGIEEAKNKILEELRQVQPGLVARDIMSSPVKTIPMDVSMEEAGRIMLRYGHTGMPVVDGDKMVGVISRRDVDKARMHNLGHAPVKGFMSREVIWVEPNTPVTEIQRIMVERDIGRVPVVEEGKLIGIVSRTDVLRTLHGEDYPEDHMILYSKTEGEESPDVRELLNTRLPTRIREIMELAGYTGESLGYRVYCVGGFVRDLLLGVPNFDVDLVVEGDGVHFAEELAKVLGGRARSHERFKTAVVISQDGVKVDVATARTEYYEFPAALPQVERSSLREDLYRRDFTINTMAIALNPDRFGELIDYFGGRRDLARGLIRILYNLSFIEDPTRILRAIRFEQRFKFRIEPDTLRLAKDAVERKLLGQLSYKRIRQEMILILSEKDPVPAIKRMQEIGVWEYVLPEVKLDEEMLLVLRRVPRVLGWLAERHLLVGLRPWVVYVMLLLSRLREEEFHQVLQRYQFDKTTAQGLKEARQVPELVSRLEEMPSPGMSDVDLLMKNLSSEGRAYFLICLKKEACFEIVTKYLETASGLKVFLKGNDLRELGIKPGPVYQVIFEELRKARIEGLARTRQDELELVKRWIEEGRFGSEGVG